MNALLVEESPTTRSQLQQVLESRGHRVIAVADAETAWLHCQDAAFEIIVLDWLLPGMDGLELCRRIRMLPWGDGTVILLVTQRNGPDDPQLALAAGVSDYLFTSDGQEALALRLAVAERQALDLTRRRQAEAALQRERDVTDAVLDTAGCLISVLACDGRIVRVNRVYEQVSGYTRDELVGTYPWDRMLPPEEEERIREFLTTLRPGQPIPEEENHLITKDGDRRLIVWSNTLLLGPDDTPLYIISAGVDITERARAERALRASETSLAQLAHYDWLTGLPNRTLFTTRLEAAVAQARITGASGALLFADLDGFKAVNDTCGHSIGDRLLRTIAERLGSCVRSTDTVARLAGDEFTVLLPMIESSADAAGVARKLIAAVAAPVLLGGYTVTVTVSIGIAVYPDDGHEPAVLLKHADSAMYAAKRTGKNRHAFYAAPFQVAPAQISS
ncbi:MAG TPA: diguanylate cyclase [Chloroflexota bacterium]|nr:diguanylate cyclase [Chloroflexota bacterium]